MSLNDEHELAAHFPSASISEAPRRRNKASKWRMAAILVAVVLAVACVIALTRHIGVSIARVTQIDADAVTWQQWLHDHALHFLIWRLFLYGATAGGWIWARRRKLQRFPTQEMAQQMLRTEVFVVALIVVFEVQKWMRA